MSPVTQSYKLRTRVDAAYLTKDNYHEVAEWCGATIRDDYDYNNDEEIVYILVPCVQTYGISSQRRLPVAAQVGKHVIFKNATGDFVVLTVERFEELWEPVELDRPLDTLVDN